MTDTGSSFSRSHVSRTHLSRRTLLAAALGAGGLTGLLVGCSGSSGDRGTASGSSSGATPSETSKALPWGPTEAQLADATKMVSSWPDEKLAGQVLVLTYDGTEPKAAASAVSAVHAAGVILMQPNIVSAEQVSDTSKAVQDALASDQRDFPAVISVDQEGGIVARLGDVVPATPSFMSAGAAIKGDQTAGESAVTDVAASTGGALRSIGFTWVFAPDADVTIGPSDPTIGSRSAGGEPELVSAAVTAAVQGYRETGIISCAKHFPGHGSVTADSHKTLPVQGASLETLTTRDLPPFKAAADAGIPAMMMSHIAVDAFEPGVPCTLSATAYATLRRDTGFGGVVCTDAMNMEAITKRYGAGKAAATAVIAGADLVLMPADAAAAHDAIVAALADGSLARERLVEAAARVVAVQLWQAAGEKPPEREASMDALAEASEGLSAAAITQVSGECPAPGTSLLDGAVQVRGGTSEDREAFVAAAENAGLSVDSGPTVLLATPSAGGSADIVVAVETPYVLARARATTAAYALYGRTPGAFAALIDVLTGKAVAPGRLPVEVAGLDALTC